MKKLLLLSIFFLNQAYAQSVIGEMDCTVTGGVVIASEEGKFRSYAGFTGGVKANDKLTLIYEVTSNSIFITLKRNINENNTVISAYLSPNKANITSEKKSNGIILSDSSFNHSISFLSDYIRISEFREFFISRYYKNDWHGLFSYVSQYESTSQTFAVNCRHTNDKMDTAFKIFTSFK
jgi:hypothetical protein